MSGEIGKRAVENNLLSKQDDELVYKLSEKLRKNGFLTKEEQDLLASKLLKDSYVDYLLGIYQDEPNKLSDAQKENLTNEINRIAVSFGINPEVLFSLDLKNTIKRSDTDVINYLNKNNNFQTQFMYASQDAWEKVPAVYGGTILLGKAVNIVAIAEKYPLLTEMGVTAVTNTAYQLQIKKLMIHMIF